MIRSAVVALILALSAPSGNAFSNAALRTVSVFFLAALMDPIPTRIFCILIDVDNDSFSHLLHFSNLSKSRDATACR